VIIQFGEGCGVEKFVKGENDKSLFETEIKVFVDTRWFLCMSTTACSVIQYLIGIGVTETVSVHSESTVKQNYLRNEGVSCIMLDRHHKKSIW
jgi:hypothetical protein